MDYQENPRNSAADAYRDAAAMRPEQKSGISTAVLILGIVSLIGICCYVNLITAPIAIIIGIVALAKHQGGTGPAVTGIVLSVLSLVVTGALLVAMWPVIQRSDEIAADYKQLVLEQDEVFPAYEADKTLPPYLSKYLEPPYSDFLQKYGVDFYDIMDMMLEKYKEGTFTKPEELQTAEADLTQETPLVLAAAV